MQRIVLLNDTSGSSNWGCKATVRGLKSFVAWQFPGAELVSVHLPALPFAKLKSLRRRYERRLVQAVYSANLQSVERHLQQLQVGNLRAFDSADLVLLNGEGSVHRSSGHTVRLLGLLYLLKQRGMTCAAVNQSLDFRPVDPLAGFVSQVYGGLDLVTVREPLSQNCLWNIGVESHFLPDFAFLNSDYRQYAGESTLDGEYVCLTGSSALKRNSHVEIERLIRWLRTLTDNPILFLASTRTDLSLAKRAQKIFANLEIVDHQTDVFQVMRLLEKASCLVGGRFHPLIFALLTQTPIIPLAGNSHKIEGLMQLTGLPFPVGSWQDLAGAAEAASYVFGQGADYRRHVSELLVQVEKCYADFNFAAVLKKAPQVPL